MLPSIRATRHAAAVRYHTVLFDLDGTLLDTIECIVISLRHTFDTHLDYLPPTSALVAQIGTPLLEQMRHHGLAADRHAGATRIDDEMVERMAQTYIDHNRGIHDHHVRPYDGIPEMLETLAEAGVRMGIVTSKSHVMADRGLVRCGLRHHFEVLVAADDVRHTKPHPEPVLTALAAMGEDAPVPTEGTLFVGDSLHDMLAGRAAGVDTAAALWGPFDQETLAPAEPTHSPESPRELLGVAQ